MTLPLPPKLALEDRIVLALYYRWGLQALSALSFIHSKDVVLCNFSMDVVWLRSDLSLAVTGFLSAQRQWYNEEEGELVLECPPYEAPRQGGPEWIDESCPCVAHNVQIDLFDWATWMWQLMINDQSVARPPNRRFDHDPINPPDIAGDGQAPPLKETADRYKQRIFQRLDRRRLGDVLVKVWHGEYETAEAIMKDVTAVARELDGVVVDGDEVTIEGMDWPNSYRLIPIDSDRGRYELRFTVFGEETEEEHVK